MSSYVRLCDRPCTACMQQLLQFLHRLTHKLWHSQRMVTVLSQAQLVRLTRLLRRVRSNSLSSRPRVLSLRSSCMARKHQKLRHHVQANT